MAILVSRNTLWMQMRGVFLLPFILMYAMVFVHFATPLFWLLGSVIRRLPERFVSLVFDWTFFAFNVAVLALVVWMGAVLGVDREQAYIWGGMILFLWAIAILLSLVDRVRYRGWTVEANDQWDTDVTLFATLLLASNAPATLLRTTSRYRSSSDAAKHAEHVQNIASVFESMPAFMKFDEPGGPFSLQVLPKLLPHLEDDGLEEADAVALVLFVTPSHMPQHCLRMVIHVEGDEPRIGSFEMVSIPQT